MESTGEIIVYGLNKADSTNGAFLALPTDVLGEEYFTASYGSGGTHVSQIGIISTTNNTLVSVTIPYLRRNITIVLNENNSDIYKEGDTINKTMDRFETWHLKSSEDLTGIKVTADYPVVVLSGNTKTFTNVTDGSVMWQDHLVEELIPTNSWGKQFATVPFSGGADMNQFRIIGK